MVSGDEIVISIAGVIAQRSALLGTRLRFLSAKDRTSVLELGLARTLEWFWTGYGKLRFKKGYPSIYLGYHIKKVTKELKRIAALTKPDAILPNVRSGETRTQVEDQFSVVTRNVGGKASSMVRGKIHFPVPGYIIGGKNRVTGLVLSTISKGEGECICARLFVEISDLASRVVVRSTMTRKGVIEPRASVGKYDASQLGRSNRATITQQRRNIRDLING
jgi:hypothetical protein